MRLFSRYNPARLWAGFNAFLDDIQREDAASWAAGPADEPETNTPLRRAIEEANLKIFTGEYSYP